MARSPVITHSLAGAPNPTNKLIPVPFVIGRLFILSLCSGVDTAGRSGRKKSKHGRKYHVLFDSNSRMLTEDLEENFLIWTSLGNF
jgi:hypothetical protein